MPAYKDVKRNTWYARICYQNWKKETVQTTKRGFKTKRDAQEWEREFLSRKKGEIDMKFDNFTKLYFEEVLPRIKYSTSVTKQNIIEKWVLPYFKDFKLNAIKASDVVKWQNELIATINPRTNKPFTRSYLKTIHNQLSAMLNYAVRYYNLPGNPASQAGNMGNESEIKTDYWTLEEYKKFSEIMKSYPPYYYAFEILYWCGLREGEMLALTKDDIDLDAGTVTVSKTYQIINGRELITSPKTKKSNRTVTMPRALCDEIREYYDKAGYLSSGRLFPVSKTGLYTKMKKGSEEAGIKHIRVHDLRHSHVSLLINMGYSAVGIAARMGHESIHVTYRYAHMFPSVQTEIANGLNQLIGA